MEHKNQNKFLAIAPNGATIAYSDVDTSKLIANDVWYS